MTETDGDDDFEDYSDPDELDPESRFRRRRRERYRSRMEGQEGDAKNEEDGKIRGDPPAWQRLSVSDNLRILIGIAALVACVWWTWHTVPIFGLSLMELSTAENSIHQIVNIQMIQAAIQIVALPIIAVAAFVFIASMISPRAR